ncbi:MmpS family transport accessory protein [Mycobacterium montefiorense]|nr:MmpS family transport accessory protein [Mycobacterium montefiorense]
MLLVAAVVVSLAAFAIHRLSGAFAAQHRPSTTDGISNDIIPFNPKRMKLEVLGTQGSVATINYLDADTQLQEVVNTALPWSYTITTTEPVVIGNLVAQGDGDFIGCRITVNGVVKDERTISKVNGYVYCLDKSG